jgi:two-component system, OmpR family, sensor kinase
VRLPIRARLTLISASLMAVVLAVSGVFLYLRLRSDLLEAVDSGLQSRAEDLVTTLKSSPAALQEGGGLIDPGDAFAQVLGPNGTVIASSPGLRPNPLLTPAEVSALQRPRLLDRTAATMDESVEARLLAVRIAGGSVLVVGVSLDDQHEALARLAALMAVGGPLVLILAGGVGWVVAGAALRPVERMRIQAAAISASEPGRRLPPAGTGDEVARLGETLNEMLDRLEQALQRERRFVDEASHELRTPLANLRIEVDLALRRARSSEELEAALRSAAGETERLARLAEDLLVLARADRGRVPLRREEVDVAELVGGEVDAFAARAGQAGVAIEARVPTGLRSSVDPLRMRQAVGNLLDNAIRSTPPQGTVTIEVGQAHGFLSLEVRDTGEGFPAAFLRNAFEPFARPDAPRSRPDRDAGSGLGLAIVRAVAEAHGGTVAAANRPDGGAEVRLRIPDARLSSSAHVPLTGRRSRYEGTRD